MESYDILVIILSVFLAIFLLLGIVIMVKVLQIMKQAKAIATDAEEAVANVRSATNKMASAASAVSVSKAISKVVNVFTKEDK